MTSQPNTTLPRRFQTVKESRSKDFLLLDSDEDDPVQMFRVQNLQQALAHLFKSVPNKCSIEALDQWQQLGPIPLYELLSKRKLTLDLNGRMWQK